MDETNEEQEPQEKEVAAKRKPRRWRWIFLGLFSFLLLALVWLNGPGWRWIAQQAVARVMPKFGMDLQADFAGRLSAGDISVNNLSWRARDGSGEAKLKHLQVRYDPRDVSKGKIIGIRVDGVDATLDLAGKLWQKSGEKPASEPLTMDAIREKIAFAREKFLPIALDVRDVNVEISRGKEFVARAKQVNFSHETGSELMHLGYQQLDVAAIKHELPAQTMEARWTKQGFELNELAVFEQARLAQLRVQHTPNLAAKALVFLGGGEILVDATEDRATLQLQGGAIDTREIEKILEKPLPEQGILSELSLKGKLVGEQVSVSLDGLRWKGENALKTLDLHDVLVDFSKSEIRDGKIQRVSLKNGSVSLDLEKLPAAKPAATPEPAPVPMRTTQEITQHVHKTLKLVLEKLGVAREKAIALDVSIANLAIDVHRGKQAVFVTPRVALAHAKNADDWTLSLAAADLGTAGKAAAQDVHLVWTDRAISLDRIAITNDLVARNFSLVWPEDRPQADVQLEAFGTKSKLSVSAIRGELRLLEGELTSEKLAAFLPENLRQKGRLSEMQVTWETHDQDFGQGRCEIAALRGTIPQSGLPFSVQARANFAWPQEIREAQVKASWGTNWVELEAGMTKEIFHIQRVLWSDEKGPKIQGQGEIPVGKNPADWKSIFLNESRPMNVRIELMEQPLSRLAGAIPALSDRARVQAFFALSGSPSQPELHAECALRNLELPAQPELKTSHARFVIDAKNQALVMRTTLENPQQIPLSAEVKFPWKTRDWVKNPELIQKEKIQAEIKLAEMDLSKFQPLVPQLAKLEGKFHADVQLTGTAANPKPLGTIDLKGGLVKLKSATMPAFEGINLSVRADERECRLLQATVSQAGGIARASGVLRWQGYKPQDIDAQVRVDSMPVVRNDALIVRTNADLRLRGPWTQAVLSGNVNIVDGVFYKDIEILPIGTPFRQPASPNLPNLQVAKPKQVVAGISPPFSNWRVNLRVKTANDFLIRGNLARGDISADLTVGGTIANPEPRGQAKLNKVLARLPFSTLRIRQGTVTFRPDAPFDPILNIRGKSVVRPYDLDVFAYGPVSNSQILLNSNPPLPENEIMTLLATGTTSKGLEDSRAAMSRGVQLLIEEARRGRVRYARRLMPILNLVQNVDFQIGSENQFTGQRFNSATLRLHRHWQVSAGIGEEGNSRMTMIYLIQR